MKKENDFKLLNEAEHILIRPNMYIGSTSLENYEGIIDGEYKSLKVVPGLLKIINEIIDNSVDEFVRTKGKFANKIDVSIEEIDNLIEQGNLITVSDNGRGIPNEYVGEKKKENLQPVLAWTRARAGSNFGDDRTTIGANGVGSFCTNVFSSEFIGINKNNGKEVKVLCKNNSIIDKIRVKDTDETGVEVKFVPDLKLFGLETITEDHYTLIKDRLKNLMICYPGLYFTFNGEKLKFRNNKEFASQFSEHNVLYQDLNNIIVVAPTDESEEFRLLTYVNGLYIKNGGAHVDYILDKIITPLREFCKKKHKIDVLPNQIKSQLTLVVFSRDFKNLKFDSQTKEKITNTQAEVSVQYNDVDFNKLAKQILNKQEIIDPIIQALLFKKEQAERLKLARMQKKKQKTKVVNHIAATSQRVTDKTLFITEGLSAIGQLISVRDAKKVGGYPLKGKLLNTRDKKPVDILKNKEISELLYVIGLEFGKKSNDLNYDKIAILTDADEDGSCISCLLLNLFSFWPELFDGHVYKCETPLYICTKGKDVQWFYNKEDFAKANLKGYDVKYFKGLGSLPKQVYKEVINNPRLVEITYSDMADKQRLDMAFGSSSELRKEWLIGYNYG